MTEAELQRRVVVANDFLGKVMQRLPPHEAQALGYGVSSLAKSHHLRDAVVRIVDAGLGPQLLTELTSVKNPAHRSPYEGCESPASVLWARTAAFARSVVVAQR